MRVRSLSISVSRRSRDFPAYPQSTSQRATIFCEARLMRLARPMPPTPMPAMLSMSLGGTKPRPRTWRGTIVRAAVAAACERNFRRGIVLSSVMGSSLAAKRVPRDEAPQSHSDGTWLQISSPRRIALLCFAEELWGDEPDELAVRRRHSLQLDKGDSGFLHRCDVAWRADSRCQQPIDVRRMTKAKYRRCVFFSREFAKERGGFGTGKQAFRLPNLLLRIVKRAGENRRGLRGAHVRAADHQVPMHSQSCNALGNLLRFLDAFLGQIPLSLRWALRVFALDRDAMADDVELQESGSLLTGNRLPIHLRADYKRAGPACRKYIRT